MNEKTFESSYKLYDPRKDLLTLKETITMREKIPDFPNFQKDLSIALSVLAETNPMDANTMFGRIQVLFQILKQEKYYNVDFMNPIYSRLQENSLSKDTTIKQQLNYVQNLFYFLVEYFLEQGYYLTLDLFATPIFELSEQQVSSISNTTVLEMLRMVKPDYDGIVHYYAVDGFNQDDYGRTVGHNKKTMLVNSLVDENIKQQVFANEQFHILVSLSQEKSTQNVIIGGKAYSYHHLNEFCSQAVSDQIGDDCFGLVQTVLGYEIITDDHGYYLIKVLGEEFLNTLFQKKYNASYQEMRLAYQHQQQQKGVKAIDRKQRLYDNLDAENRNQWKLFCKEQYKKYLTALLK